MCVLDALFAHMGLGKTLQSLCIVAGDHYYRKKEFMVQLQSLPLECVCVCVCHVALWFCLMGCTAVVIYFQAPLISLAMIYYQ